MAFEAPEIEISSDKGDPSDIRHITGVVSLPTGASTAARQDSQTSLLTGIDNKTPALVSGRVPVDGSAVTQPISASALPLPAGASTLVEQQTQTTRLTSINDKIAALSTTPLSWGQLATIVRAIPFRPPTFVLNAVTVALANNKSMVALQNGSVDKILTIQAIKIINNRTTATTGVAVDFRFRRITGLSAGTAITLQPYDTADSVPSGVIAATGGTVAGEATLDLFRRVWSSDEWGTGTVDVEAQDHSQQQLGYAWQNLTEAKGLMLRPNQGFTLKNITNTTSGDFDFEIIFTVGDV